jgi:very-short-patch-repair endonuclease
MRVRLGTPSPGPAGHPLPHAGEGIDKPLARVRERVWGEGTRGAREWACTRLDPAVVTVSLRHSTNGATAIPKSKEHSSPRDRLTRERAKTLRSRQTDAEQKLWYRLRAKRFLGLKFKRQYPVGPFIVDFVCLARGLAIEINGGQPAEQQDQDARRTRYLNQRGLRVLRYWNDDVLHRTDAVLEHLRLCLAETPSPPAPLPHAGEGSE